MAGRKMTPEEKQQAREMVKSGYTISELQQKWPDVDGRILSAIYMRHRQRSVAPEVGSVAVAPVATASSAAPAVPPAVPSPSPQPAQVVVVPAAPVLPPMPTRTPQQEAAEAMGFDPAPREVLSSVTPQGFMPGHREYFIIEKKDPPGEGVVGKRYPPFGVDDLMEQYPPGDYEIHHFRDGRLFNVMRKKIAPRVPSQGSPVGTPVREVKTESPADTLIKGIDLYHRIHSESKAEIERAHALEVSAKAEAEKAKADVEKTATAGLISLVSELGKPRLASGESVVERIFQLMQEDRRTLEVKLQNEITLMRERHKMDLEAERERVRLETERAKREAEERIARERMFMEKLQELDQRRQELWKESYDKMMAELQATQEAFNRELEEKRKWLDQYSELQRKHTDEIIQLKRSLGDGNSARMLEVVKDGVVQSLDRIGHRIDVLVREGVIGDKKGGALAGPTASEAAVQSGEQSRQAVEDSGVFTDDEARAELGKPWFQKIKAEIVETIRRRMEGRKLHGGILGQVFLDDLNNRRGVTIAHLHWICSRLWKRRDGEKSEGILDIVRGAVTDEEMKILDTPEGEKWFSEFVGYLSDAYNRWIGVA